MPAVVSDAFVMAALKERGITNERILDGLLLAFHHDEDDDIDGAEFEALITSVDEMLQREKVPNDVPPDCKAFYRLAETRHGVYDNAPNPNLKMMRTSAGIEKGSTQDVKDTFNALKAKCPERGTSISSTPGWSCVSLICSTTTPRSTTRSPCGVTPRAKCAGRR